MSSSPEAPGVVRDRAGHPREEGRVRVLTRLALWARGHSLAGRTKRSGCRACGACCEHFGGHLQASRSDLARWRAQGRVDLLGRVNRLGWLWVDPETGRPERRCPFLVRTAPESARCAIHDTKPDMCRAYPTLAHERRCVRGLVFH